MSSAGILRRKVAFDRKLATVDTHGGQLYDWDDPANAVIDWAQIRWLRGGETVQAARLQGTQPAVVTIHASIAGRQIDPTWRMRDLATGAAANITSVILTEDERWIELTVTFGEPA